MCLPILLNKIKLFFQNWDLNEIYLKKIRFNNYNRIWSKLGRNRNFKSVIRLRIEE